MIIQHALISPSYSKDMYTCHGDDALFVATNVFKTTSVIKYFSASHTKLEKGLSYVELTRLAAEGLMRDMLLTKQARIEVYASEKGKGYSAQWRLTRKGSPGNLQDFEDLLFANTDISAAPMVLSVKLVVKGDERVCLSCLLHFSLCISLF